VTVALPPERLSLNALVQFALHQPYVHTYGSELEVNFDLSAALSGSPVVDRQKGISIRTRWMEATDPDSPYGRAMNSTEPSGADLTRIDSESDTRPFFEKSTEEKRLVRKLDQRILPIVCLLYLFACRLHLPPWPTSLNHNYIMQTWTEQTLVMRVSKAYLRTLLEAIRQEIYSTGSTLHFSSHM
jgi:hypothetical protein